MFDDFSNTPEPFEVSLTLYLTSVGLTAYPYRVPASVANVYPRMVYSYVSGIHNNRLSGPSGAVKATVQFDIYGTSQPDALVLTEQLRQSLHGYNGLMGSMTVQNVTLTEYPGFWEQLVDGSDKGTFRKTVEYEISYIETVPVFTYPYVGSSGGSFMIGGFGSNKIVLQGFG